MCYCPTPTLHLNLALTGDGAFLFSLKKTHSVLFISVLNYGDTENVLINHLLRVIPMSYPCHYTNLCPHKPHKHAHTHTHSHTHTHTHTHTHSHTRAHTHTHTQSGVKTRGNSECLDRGQILAGGHTQGHTYIYIRSKLIARTIKHLHFKD